MWGKSGVLLPACLIASFCASLALAQSTTGTIAGNVTDVSGSPIVDARVIATNVETNVSRSAVTKPDGSYSVLFLPVGTYRVEVNVPGFKKFEQTGVVLEVNRNPKVDAVLQVGAVTETVEVTADAAMVETTVPALGQTVNSQDIEELPLVNRDVYSLLTLVAGVDFTGQATDNFGAPQQQTYINGSPNASVGSVNYNLDGGTNSNGLRNTGNSIPNPDAVDQFRVVTNSYSAEYGRFAGGVVDVVTKSGTNNLHGSLFEFVRNTRTKCPAKRSSAPQPVWRQRRRSCHQGPDIYLRQLFRAAATDHCL